MSGLGVGDVRDTGGGDGGPVVVSGDDWLVIDGKTRHVTAVFEGQVRRWYVDGERVYPPARKTLSDD